MFICNNQVSEFFKTALNHTWIDIVGYNNGSGYFCLDTKHNNSEVTFVNYTLRGEKIGEGVNVKDTSPLYLIIGVAIGVVFVVIIAGTIYLKRWYLKYHYYWLIKKPIKRQEPFKYDVFISYSHLNEAWVKNNLIPQLEETEPRFTPV